MSVDFAGEALGLLESGSIAAGVRAADDVLKAAAVELVEAAPVSPGKMLVVFTGGVAETEASLAAGRRRLGAELLDELFLPNVHPDVAPALAGGEVPPPPAGEAIGVFETTTVAAAVLGADAAAKAARVRLVEISPGRGIGGKGYFTLTGEVAPVEAALEAARALVEPRGYHRRTEILAGPDPRLAERVARRLLRRFRWQEEDGGR